MHHQKHHYHHSSLSNGLQNNPHSETLFHPNLSQTFGPSYRRREGPRNIALGGLHHATLGLLTRTCPSSSSVSWLPLSDTILLANDGVLCLELSGSDTLTADEGCPAGLISVIPIDLLSVEGTGGGGMRVESLCCLVRLFLSLEEESLGIEISCRALSMISRVRVANAGTSSVVKPVVSIGGRTRRTVRCYSKMLWVADMTHSLS
jgi:hypothetical protein